MGLYVDLYFGEGEGEAGPGGGGAAGADGCGLYDLAALEVVGEYLVVELQIYVEVAGAGVDHCCVRGYRGHILTAHEQVGHLDLPVGVADDWLEDRRVDDLGRDLVVVEQGLLGVVQDLKGEDG